MKKLAILTILVNFCLMNYAAQRDYYIIQIYHCSNQKQIINIDNYLKNIYLPHLHKKGIKKVGVFAPIANDTAVDKKLFVWIPLKDIDQLDKLDQEIEKIDPMSGSLLVHLELPDSSMPYNRIERIIAKSFKDAPNYQKTTTLTASKDRIYEYRSYESQTENLHLRKVHMFNEGNEIEMFSRLNFNAIFYAKVISGSRMPNLIYMTSFNNMEDRDAHWKAFVADSEYPRLFNLSAYQKTVSRSEIVLLKARDYADF